MQRIQEIREFSFDSFILIHTQYSVQEINIIEDYHQDASPQILPPPPQWVHVTISNCGFLLSNN